MILKTFLVSISYITIKCCQFRLIFDVTRLSVFGLNIDIIGCCKFPPSIRLESLYILLFMEYYRYLYNIIPNFFFYINIKL